MEVSPRYTLLNTVHTAYTVYTVCTAYCVILHVCLYILLAKVTTLLEWADGLMSKMLDRLDG